jgi:hypothetical protein
MTTQQPDMENQARDPLLTNSKETKAKEIPKIYAPTPNNARICHKITNIEANQKN